MKKIITIFILLLTMIISASCGVIFGQGRPSDCYKPDRYCILKDGIWGSWDKIYSERSAVKYNNQKYDIYIFKEYNHPSDYDFLITINRSTAKKKDKEWTEYDGEIRIAKNTPIAGTAILNDNGRKIKCTIRADKKMTKAIDKGGLWGTINIFYGNGQGRAFSFFPGY